MDELHVYARMTECTSPHTRGKTRTPRTNARTHARTHSYGRAHYAVRWDARQTQLLLDDNLLRDLPLSLLARLPSLCRLSLSQNHLEELPDSLYGAVPDLTCIDVSGNRLEALPKDISRLTCLSELLVCSPCF